MAKRIRRVIKIDEELCNGCGLCVPSCAEGAIRVIDGKARLVADKYCDGLGACLGECPRGALSFEDRLADDFDEQEAQEHQHRTAAPVPAAASACHGEPSQGGPVGHGCPGSRMLQFDDAEDDEADTDAPKMRSQLRQWPVKLNLLNPSAPYLKDADLLLAADCSAFAFASFHPDLLKGKALAIGCPKFDDVQGYIRKLAAIIREGGVKSITVARMEVPCCLGLLMAAKDAVAASGVDIPVNTVVISFRGEIKPGAL